MTLKSVLVYSARAFAREAITVTGREEDFIFKDELYDRFLEYCRSKGLRPVKHNTFFWVLKDEKVYLRSARIVTEEGRKGALVGIVLAPTGTSCPWAYLPRASVKDFISRMVEITGNKNDITFKRDLYDAYLDFCKKNHYVPVRYDTFFRKLKQNGFSFHEVHPIGRRGTRERAFAGIQLKEPQ